VFPAEIEFLLSDTLYIRIIPSLGNTQKLWWLCSSYLWRAICWSLFM